MARNAAWRTTCAFRACQTLLFTSDDFPELAANLEGMAFLSPTELLLVSDNGFGTTSAETQFWRVRLGQTVLSSTAGMGGGSPAALDYEDANSTN